MCFFLILAILRNQLIAIREFQHYKDSPRNFHFRACLGLTRGLPKQYLLDSNKLIT